MKGFWGVSFVFLFATASLADVLVGIEHKLSVEKLQAIAGAVTRASNRSDQMQTQTAYYEITETILVQCGPHKPDKDGKGCDLIVNPVTQAKLGEISMSLTKPIEKLLVVQKAAEIKDKVAAADPNSTEDHLHVGNPIYQLANGMKDGTHYYCAPEGKEGAKIWQCYLSVAERLSQTGLATSRTCELAKVGFISPL